MRRKHSIKDGMKICTGCKLSKPVSEFSPRGNGNVRSRCRPCVVQATKDRWETMPLDKRQQKMERSRCAEYGITPEEYANLLENQVGQCAICSTTDPGRKGNAHFCIDHDHATGHLRALLCHNCNLGLGRFKDDPVILQLAINYLRDHSQVKVTA